jgi:hypothetical protein
VWSITIVSETGDRRRQTSAFRSTLHGFVALESGGGFGLNVDIDRSFERLVQGIVIALASWTDLTAQEAVSDRGGES